RVVLATLTRRGVLRARSALKRAMLRKIRALPPERLAAYAAYFAQNILPQTLAHIAAEHFDEVAVVSASERHIIEATLRDSGFPYTRVIANDFDELEDFVTCWGAEKVLRAARQYPGNARQSVEFTVYTDSAHDAPLIEFAQRAFLVGEAGVSKIKG
ncbi:MAG: haloacid dehalogenase-like hydrolase, partial [Oscillospiraceae bacterium]|nr:haloacid dehalogenase-like hydrolase [Oscillospiraceae bacterium]